MLTKYKVLLVDDHKVVREGLAYLLKQHEEFGAIECAGEAHEALNAMNHSAADLVVVDVSLGKQSGLDLLKKLHAEHPHARLLVLSMHDELLYAERCLRAGASGYIMKSEGHDKIVQGLREVLAGKIFISDAVRERIFRKAINYPNSSQTNLEELLSDREFEVYRLIGKGLTTQQIAGNLNVSPKTIQSYRNNLKEKLGIENATELTQRAVLWQSEQFHRGDAKECFPN